MTKRERSLKAKLLTLTLSINLALGIVSLGLEHRSAGKIKDQLMKGFHQNGEVLHDNIAAQFFERYGDVQAFSKNDTLLKGSREEMAQYLNDMVALYGIYDLVLVVNKKGKLVAVNTKAADGKEIPTGKLLDRDYSQESWFKKTMAGETTDDKSKGFSGTLIEDPIFDRDATEVYGETRYTNTFATQMKNSAGEVIGVICNRTNIKWITFDYYQMARNFVDAGYKDFKLGLINGQGTVLLEVLPSHDKEPATAPLDPARLGKLNYTSLGFEPATKLITEKQEEAFGLTKDPETANKQVYYSGHHIDGDKWVGSIGWKVLVQAEKEDAEAVLLKVSSEAQKIYITLFSIISVLALLGGIWFSNRLAKQLENVLNGLTTSSQTILGAAQSGTRLSTDLAEGATEQAAAIQETAAAVDEVAAMVKKNADNAAQSRSTSAEGSALAETGKQSMNRLVSAIGDIRQSNEDIMKQVEEGNQKISQIVQLITEIESKTKVINDIVFQTKLLSFNASVEAARAGEHGKGFAVVAEEVGNLAQMSGNAAKEISEMLTQSVTQVQAIVDSTRAQVSTLIERGKSKVLAGTELAEESEKALDQLLDAVGRIDTSVSEIAEASKEQSQGTSEIQKAINQLDQVTQQNSTAARESATTAEELNEQVTTMHELVEELRVVLRGGTIERSGTKPAPIQVATAPSKKPIKLVKKEAKTSDEKHTLEVPSESDPRFKDVG